MDFRALERSDRPGVAILSSRLGRKVEQRSVWFQALRAACSSLDPAQEELLIAHGSAAARYVGHCAERLNLPARCLSQTLNPPAFSAGEGPQPDRLLIWLATKIIVLSLRPAGNIDHLLRARMKDTCLPPCSVLLLDHPELISQELLQELTGLGAERLALPEPSQPMDACYPSPVPIHSDPEMYSASFGSEEYLTHWTRYHYGPWPDQTERDYLDDLIMQREDADHSALAALRRIVKQQRLLATARFTRGPVPVVCFTAVPLQELLLHRVYRRHLGRWDFEPYGICIRQSWLQRNGARPVIYGEDAVWATLDSGQQPFFQLAQTRGGRNRIDWSNEREWRHVGAVDLARLPDDEAFLFVPTRAEARQLACFSRWPVKYLGEE